MRAYLRHRFCYHYPLRVCAREKSCLMMRIRLGIQHIHRERQREREIIVIIIINDGAKKEEGKKEKKRIEEEAERKAEELVC